MHKFVLGLEVAFGVLPITIVGAVYGAMGTVFGTVSVLVSIYERSASAAFFWLGVLALALGGLVGIAGLWLLVVVSELGATRGVRMAALLASAAGVVVSLVALTYVIRAERPAGWTAIYLLISPIVVVGHRAYRCWRRPLLISS